MDLFSSRYRHGFSRSAGQRSGLWPPAHLSAASFSLSSSSTYSLGLASDGPFAAALSLSWHCWCLQTSLSQVASSLKNVRWSSWRSSGPCGSRPLPCGLLRCFSSTVSSMSGQMPLLNAPDATLIIPQGACSFPSRLLSPTRPSTACRLTWRNMLSASSTRPGNKDPLLLATITIS